MFQRILNFKPGVFISLALTISNIDELLEVSTGMDCGTFDDGISLFSFTTNYLTMSYDFCLCSSVFS